MLKEMAVCKASMPACKIIATGSKTNSYKKKDKKIHLVYQMDFL
jgi:hypothetical protein